MTSRLDVVQNQRAKDEYRADTVVDILDYLEEISGSSDSAARTKALDITDVHQLHEGDLNDLYDYIDLLGSPTRSKRQFVGQLRDRDFMSRRAIEYILDQIDEAFGVEGYASIVFKDMVATGGSFFPMQDAVASPLTDVGPAGVTDMTAASPAGVVTGPWPGAQARGDDAGIVEDWDSVSVDPSTGASESATWECWVRSPSSAVFQTLLGTFLPSSITTALAIRNATGVFRGTSRGTVALPDPGAWAMTTAYVTGDRRRLISDVGARVNEVEVAGTSAGSEPTFPTDGTTVVDGTVTWRDLGTRATFHDIAGIDPPGGPEVLEGAVDVTDGKWRLLALVKDSTGLHLYVNGVLVDEELILAVDTGPGSFGLPVKLQFDTAAWNGTNVVIGGQIGGSELLLGSMCFVAFYTGALTSAQLLAHYNRGVELGLVT